MLTSTHSFKAGDLPVEVHSSQAAMGAAAAHRAAKTIRDAVTEKGKARVVIATGNSQLAFVDALKEVEIPWERVTVFHMDEYVGIDAEHSASFRRWIRERVEVPLSPATVEYIHGDAPNAQQEADRYEALLRDSPLDLVCMGIGENGHLAFNEPFDADFDDPRWARVITLSDESVRQQVGEGHFPDEESTPRTAISLTIPALLSARSVQVCVPESRKAGAIAATVNAPINTACPSTCLRQAAHAVLFLEPASAVRLTADS